MCSDDFARAGRGDLLIFASALLYALHILALSRYSPKVPALWLACVQFSVCAALNTAAAFAFESVTLPSLSAAFGSIAFAGLLSSALAYTLQIVALKHVKPTVTSLIFCLEAVFALLAGWIVLNERLSTREWIGCAVVFGAIVVSQLPSLKRKKAGHHNSI